MDPGTTPAKTDKGRREMTERSGSLTAVERRLLILADGKKTINDLGAYVRIGELESGLAHLLALGLIAPTGEVVPLHPPVEEGFSSSRPQELARAATSPPEFKTVRAEAARFVRDRMGHTGASIGTAIDGCRSPHELRALLRGIEPMIGRRLEPADVQTFARHFGAMLL